jgi:exo-1,4-beta-D-glucosaminidase
MTGPYDWIAPSYWYLDVDRGGAFGFNTETGPGPAVAERDSLEAMLTPSQLDALWTGDGRQLHAGAADSAFDNLGLFNEALRARLGTPASLDDYVAKAQLMSYEAERAEYEAYGRNKYDSATGVIHWLLNSAWPSLIWHLYGYDLAPAGGYFGAKKANEPLHIQYSYDDRSVVVVNHTPQARRGLRAAVSVHDLDGNVIHSEEADVDVGADAVARVLTIPQLDIPSATYFVALTLTRGDTLESTNVYWLSRNAEIIDFDHADWFHAPTLEFADLSALADLATTEVDLAAVAEGEAVRVTVENPASSIAFFIRLQLTRGPGGAPVLPVFWSDNYISLMPHERRELVVRYDADSLAGASPSVSLRGWNVPARTVTP